MAIKPGREYRNMQIEIKEAEENENQDYLVRGYASTFQPYVLFEEDGIKYSEQIDETAFDEADMSDVVFLYNHEGMVHAR